MLAPDEMRAVVLRYFSLFAHGDVEGIVALFAPDAVLEDPVGQDPMVGADALRAFFQAGFGAVGGRILFEAEGAVRIAGRYAACAAIATCDRAEPPFFSETLDVMEFGADGKIVSMKAYWGPTNAHPLEKSS
jgi:steroid delta-isomerase